MRAQSVAQAVSMVATSVTVALASLPLALAAVDAKARVAQVLALGVLLAGARHLVQQGRLLQEGPSPTTAESTRPAGVQCLLRQRALGSRGRQSIRTCCVHRKPLTGIPLPVPPQLQPQAHDPAMAAVQLLVRARASWMTARWLTKTRRRADMPTSLATTSRAVRGLYHLSLRASCTAMRCCASGRRTWRAWPATWAALAANTNP